MPLSPTISPQIHHTSPYLTSQETIDNIDDDFADLALPSSTWNAKAYKRQGPRGRKSRAKRNVEARQGDSVLLKLPIDVLKLLLIRIPPRSLAALAGTCVTLRADLEDEAIWRRSYVHHFIGENAPEALVRTLVQPCAVAGQGWRKEALERQVMLENWLKSHTAGKAHHPNVGPIHRLSLAYPQSTRLQTADTPRTLKEKYEAHIATTTRPAPYVLSAGLSVGGIVRSDPLSGKLSKGYWGPRVNANFHLRPHLDTSDPPTAIYMHKREQGFAIWGLASGKVVRNLMGAKSHTANRLRATSSNVQCAPEDAHIGVVECVHATGADTFVSGGSDGRVKIWRYEAPERPSVNANGGSADLAGRLMCIFTSTPSETTFADRPEESKYRVAMRPDGIVCARYDEERDVLCSVSSDGELRVWFDLTTTPREVRVDVGARHEYGGVTRIELDVRDGIASVLVLHDGHSDLVGNGDLLYRFDIEPDGSSLRTAFVGAGNITALHVDFAPTLPITKAVPVKADTPSLPSTPDTEPTTPLPDLTTPITQADERGKYGRYVVVGNSTGECAWYAWDDLTGASSDLREPLRKWTVGRGAVSSIDAAASLVAVGTTDGQIRLFDPLPSPPALLRAFHTVPHSSSSSASTSYLSLAPRHIILDSDLLVAACGVRVCTYRAAPKQRDGREKGRKRSLLAPASSSGNGGGGASGIWNAAELRAAQREAKAEIDELRQGQQDARMQLARQRDGNNAGLEEDAAVQLALLLSMEQDQGHAAYQDVPTSALSASSAAWGNAASVSTFAGLSASRLADEYEAFHRGHDHDDDDDDGDEFDYSYEYEDSYDSTVVPTPSKGPRTIPGSATRGSARSREQEEDEFEGMSDGEIEAIKAVREFERGST